MNSANCLPNSFSGSVPLGSWHHPLHMWNSVFNHRPMGPLEDICSSLLHGYILSRTLNIAATLDYVNSDICFLISKTLVLLGFLLPVLGLEVSSRLKTGATAHFLSLRYQPMLPGLQYLAELFLLTFLTPKMWAAFFPPTPTNSPTLWIPTRCHKIPFDSDTNGWEFSQFPQELRSQLQILGCHLYFWPASCHPLLKFVNFLKVHSTSESILFIGLS